MVGSALGAALPFVIVHGAADPRATDAYFLAAGSAILLVSLIGIVVEGSVVPYVVERRAAGREHLTRFVRRTAAQAAGLVSVMALGALAVLHVLALPRTSMDVDQRRLVIEFVALLTPWIATVAVASTYAGALNGMQRFGVPSWSVACRGVGGIVGATVGVDSFGLHAVPIGLLCGELVRVLILTGWLQSVVRSVPSVGTASSGRLSFWRGASPQVLAMVIVGVNPIIDKLVAARLTVGSVTILELAEKVFFAPVVLLSSGVVVVFGAIWADLAQSSRDGALRRSFVRAQIGVAVATVGMSVVLVAAAMAWSGTLAEQLRIDASADLRHALMFYVVGLPTVGVQLLSARVLVACRRLGKLPLIATVSLVTNTVFDVVGAHLWGVAGIAVASTGYRLVSAVLTTALALRVLADWRDGHPA